MKRIVLMLLIAVFILSGVLPLYGASYISPTIIILTVGETSALVNSGTIHLDVAPFIKDGRTFVPLRFVSEQLGATVECRTWGDKTVNQIIISMDWTVVSSLTGKVMILSENSFIASAGSTHIIGMVQNQTGESVCGVKIIATFYDASGQVVGTNYTYSQQGGDPRPGEAEPCLQPNEITSFELVWSQKIPWDHYSLQVDCSGVCKLTIY
jgi:hypothetical protein